MKLDEQKAKKRKQLLRETRELLLNVQQQYNVPIQILRPKKRPRVVRNFMKKEVQTVDPNTKLKDASELLLSKEITHLPVLEENRLVGIATRTDVLRGLVEGFETVEEVMTKEVITVNVDDSVQSVIRKASEVNISVFPVIDVNGNLLGTVSIEDL